MARLVPICKDLEEQVLQCYKQNPGRSLDCSDTVRSYQQCVNNARKVQSDCPSEMCDLFPSMYREYWQSDWISAHAHTHTHIHKICVSQRSVIMFNVL